MSNINKKVFLTGGTAGIGRALLLLMAEKGYQIFAIGRDAEKKADLSTDIRERQLEAQIHIHLLDLADTSALEKELPEIWAEHGPFDILINNAALGFDGVEGKIWPKSRIWSTPISRPTSIYRVSFWNGWPRLRYMAILSISAQ